MKLVPASLLCSCLVFTPLPAVLFADDFRPPAIPTAGKNADTFVPRGWKIIKRATGDLNKDKLPDLALALSSAEKSDSYNDTWDEPRLLVILFKEKSGGYRRATVSSNAIMCRGCGGVFGDPFDELSVTRGTIVIRHYGGSRQRWGFTHRFRFQNGDWYLIGRTTIEHDTITREYHELDENLLTGDTIEKVTTSQGREVEKKERRAKKPLIRLSAHDVVN